MIGLEMNSRAILVVEDEADIREVIAFNLKREGFAVRTAADGVSGLEAARTGPIDLLILDLMLPRMDGLEVCRRLRADAATRHLPILILSAKGEESDIVLGLGLGADDYICKPFSPRELVARVQAVLRREVRSGTTADPLERVTHGGLVVDIGRHEVLVDGAAVAFTATQLKLLHHLASHPGRVFTREQLLDFAVGTDVVVTDRNVDVHMRAIRQKLGKYAESIVTVRGVGYRFADGE